MALQVNYLSQQPLEAHCYLFAFAFGALKSETTDKAKRFQQ